MCVVSNIGDYWKNKLPEKHPWTSPWVEDPYKPINPNPNSPNGPLIPLVPQGPTREEFEALKKEMQELKELLKAGQKFDAATNQPHCEHEDKVALIKKMAELVGVDLEDVLK